MPPFKARVVTDDGGPTGPRSQETIARLMSDPKTAHYLFAEKPYGSANRYPPPAAAPQAAGSASWPGHGPRIGGNHGSSATFAALRIRL